MQNCLCKAWRQLLKTMQTADTYTQLGDTSTHTARKYYTHTHTFTLIQSRDSAKIFAHFRTHQNRIEVQSQVQVQRTDTDTAATGHRYIYIHCRIRIRRHRYSYSYSICSSVARRQLHPYCQRGLGKKFSFMLHVAAVRILRACSAQIWLRNVNKYIDIYIHIYIYIGRFNRAGRLRLKMPNGVSYYCNLRWCLANICRAYRLRLSKCSDKALVISN